MKVSFIEKSYVTVLMVILAGIVVHAPLSVWLGATFPDYSLLIKSWKEILLCAGILLALCVITRRMLWIEILRDRVCQMIAAYVACHLILIVALYQGFITSMAGLAIDLRYVVFFGLVYVAMIILPHYRRRLLWTTIIGACVVVGFATLQLFLPADILAYIGYGKDTIMPYLTVDQNPDFVRVNSTLRGPNPLGAYVSIVLGLIAAALIRKKLDLRSQKVRVLIFTFTVCSLVALWLSYSRSALVAGFVAVSVVLLATIARRLPRNFWIITSVLAFAVAGGLIATRDSSFVSNVLLHENLEGGSSVSSNEQHIASLEYGFDRLVHQPFGAGVGSTGSASLYGSQPVVIENQYLFIAHEVGWVGVLLFLGLFGIILYRLWLLRRDWLGLGVFASGIGLGLIGLLQPVWVDDTVSIVWWGLAAIALAGKGVDERKQTK